MPVAIKTCKFNGSEGTGVAERLLEEARKSVYVPPFLPQNSAI